MILAIPNSGNNEVGYAAACTRDVSVSRGSWENKLISTRPRMRCPFFFFSVHITLSDPLSDPFNVTGKVQGGWWLIHFHYLTSKNFQGNQREETFTLFTIYTTRRALSTGLRVACLLWLPWKWNNEQLGQPREEIYKATTKEEEEEEGKKNLYLEHNPPKWISRRPIAASAS